LKDFSDWEVIDYKFSGASEKIALFSKKEQRSCVFKFPKKFNEYEEEVSSEYFSEKLSKDIADALKIKCAEVDIGMYQGRIGSASYFFINDIFENDTKEKFIEGIQFIENKYPSFNRDAFMDIATKEYYSIDMILNSLPNETIMRQFYEILIFDALIGNSDRHYSNWGIIKYNSYELAPLYDNGSSLCSYIKDQDSILDDFFTDSNRFNALVDTKSKSIIRIKGKAKPSHFEVLKYIFERYGKDCERVIIALNENLTEKSIGDMIHKYRNMNILSNKKLDLILKFLISKRNKILNLYNERRIYR